MIVMVVARRGLLVLLSWIEVRLVGISLVMLLSLTEG